MWFLLIQIIFFMCLAAGLGALAAWWWLRRRFVDVTDTHTELTRQVEAAVSEGRVLTRDDVRAEITNALLAYRPPETDFSPLVTRLNAVDARLSNDPRLEILATRLVGLEDSIGALAPALSAIPEQQAAGLEGPFGRLSDRLDEIAARIAETPPPDLAPVLTRLDAVEERIGAIQLPETDFSPLLTRLADLEMRIGDIKLPEVDLGPVHSGLARLDLSLSELQLPDIDLAPLTQRLADIEAELLRLDAQPLLAEFSGHLVSLRGAVDDIEMPAPLDLSSIHTRLAELDITLTDRIAQIETRLTATAPINEALISTLAGMEADLNVVAARRPQDIEPMYGQLAALDASLGSIRAEVRALPRSEALERRLEALERRLGALQESLAGQATPAFSRQDIIALEDRLTAIEYGLTALHHMMRARPEAPRAETVNGASDHVSRRAVQVKEPQKFDAAQKSRRLKAIASVRKPDDEANLLTHAAFGEGDDLAQIIGVGPILTELLHEVGVFYFWQISEWSDDDVAYVDGKLMHFRGRIERDDWVGQARQLSSQPGAARRPGAS